MAYIPPHKRHLKDPVKPSPVPDYLLTRFKKNIDFKSRNVQGNVVTYSGDFISKWFLIGSNGINDEFLPSSVKLVPLSFDSSECRDGAKPLLLMNNDFQKVKMINEVSEEEERTRWLLVAEKVEKDLVSAYVQAKKRMDDHQLLDNAKLRLVARFGKMMFYGHQARPTAQYLQNSWNRKFSTDVPIAFIENIKSKAIPSHGFCIDAEKEMYIVKVSHYSRPDATISCKCKLKEDGRLNMYKAELNPVRHLVVDFSCINKNLDMRLMLAGKRKMTALTEKEMSNIQELLDSATVDQNVKGGLRWPVVTTSSENRYRLLESCHVRTTIYKNRALTLRVRETDRFSEVFGTGEIERGVTLILQDINAKLQEQNIERICVVEML